MPLHISKRGKRPLNAYQKFVKAHWIKSKSWGQNMTDIALLWKK